ncbi:MULTISPECIES: asparagine synthase-related protein [Nocardia]|uniref:asparagine synthase-related protein n=2 Tax=Nocardiaceae TaxID=85025 RepID=UPI00245415DF|nr:MULTISPECIES: asparagine synthase-related protein [Nocardia]
MNLTAQTFEPLEYVSDILPGMKAPNPDIRTITDPQVAAEHIEAETASRLDALFEHFTGTPAVLLSGGVDSIYVAAVAVRLGARPQAITIITNGESDAPNATAAAAALGLTHDVIRLEVEDVVSLARVVMNRLGTSELWEVTAGIPLVAALPTLSRITNLGAILTGSGADAIFGGGRKLTHPVESAEARAELDGLIRAESSANFRYDRLVPDFYPDLLRGFADRLVHVFQTVRWWQVAEQFAPPALFGEHNGAVVDKLALRLACSKALPDSARRLAWTAKAPIQRSSGLMPTLATAAREFAANLPGATTYTDPRTEDPEAVATRLYLALLNDN